jgi:hypothetical protein
MPQFIRRHDRDRRDGPVEDSVHADSIDALLVGRLIFPIFPPPNTPALLTGCPARRSP